MNCERFLEDLFPFVDGELPEAEARAATAHVAACSECAARVDFERSLEARIGSALLGDADADEAARIVAETIAQAQAPAQTPADAPTEPERSSGAPTDLAETTPAGRVVPFPSRSPWIGLAASLLVAVSAAWFFCIPPFECSILQAVERSTEASAETLRPGVVGPAIAERVSVPSSLAGLARDGDAEFLTAGTERLRARFAGGEEAVEMVWSEPEGALPSFRRKREIGGRTWWVADENGKRLVAWMCPETDTLCTLVADLPEERLLEMAEQAR